MARVKIAYVGGGSTRAPGTISAFVERPDDFAGSEIVLIDLDAEHLEIVARFGSRLAQSRDVDISFSTTTDRRAGLRDCDGVLTSFRPGGFEARALDERLPLRHGLIGQETQGPGGFFMALRSIPVMASIAAEMAEVCPDAWIFNYTNPVNIVSQAVTQHTDVPIVSLCEGSIVFPRFLLESVGLDPAEAEIQMAGLNHATWSTTQRYRGDDLIPLLREAYEGGVDRDAIGGPRARQLHLAAVMGSVPSEYFQYYYFRDEILDELRGKATTRAEDIVSETPLYWQHYEEQANSRSPVLDPARSRIGILELELAIDVMAAMFNGRTETHYVNVRNDGGALPGLPTDVVVELLGSVGPGAIEPIPQRALPRHVSGLVEMLAEYQVLAAEAAWSGTRVDAIRALASNPLVLSLPLAERLYDEMSASQRDLLPERLLA